MYKALAPGCIGHWKPFAEAAALTAEAGFGGYWFSIESDSAISVSETREILEKNNLRAAGFNLPLEFRKDEAVFKADMAKLEGRAKYAAAIGAGRCITWLMPASETLDYKENFNFHRERLTEAAKVLESCGVYFGLEFVGTPSARQNAKYPFIYNLRQTLELCDAIGTGNMGVLLDLWHWDLAGHTRADFGLIKDEKQIVLAHINDAPAGVPPGEQRDGKRRLPGASGVLNAADFFGGLKSLNYAGPVVPEPFDESLSAMPFEQALRAVMNAVDAVWPG